ncbi:hypothetical protein EJV47_21435 [Hymenobacter gummosus]|uniref:Uncharacterized protein n=1 Tax=Hymenobacter gummosus TaxID=1776032 RepID=A0A431TXN9_9BACT|nr:hypothetical protein [Hymenobacter gummosus]RTQ46518.1 hypothetical protein EJV47_21435 [Hymenobacter gummosus]
MTHSTLLLTLGLLLAGPAGWAQGRGNDKDNDKKEHKGEKDKKYEDRDKDDERYKGRGNDDRNARGGTAMGGILGRVIFPPAGTVGPRRLEGVPRGHYPPPGECRIWYPNRPPGQQPPPLR